MKQFRILHVITRLDKGGSAENTLLTVLGNLSHGHHVELICGVSEYPPSENEESAKKQGAVIIRLKHLVREISLFNDIIVTVQLLLYMKKHPCDVLHTHTSKAGILGRFAAFFTGINCIVHTPHGHIFWGYFSPLKTRILVAVERFVTRKTDTLITLTQGERKDYIDRHFCAPERIIPIFSGIDLEPYLAETVDKKEMRQQLGIPQNAYIAGTVARLVHIKNHDLIVSAAEILGNSIAEIKYVFVGDGDLHDHLVNRIERAGLTDKFIFLGWRNDTAALLKAFDLFVMCSHNEGMGRAFVEAQASGLPVIGSRVGGIPEVIQEGITGYLVPPDKPAVLADSIKQMYNKRNEREAIAKKCREWVNPRFGKEIMVDLIEKIYTMGVNKHL